MKTSKKNAKGHGLQKGNQRWKWMAGAVVAGAAASPSSDAKTVQINLLNGPGHSQLAGTDITGDGKADVVVHIYTQDSTSVRFQVNAAGFNVFFTDSSPLSGPPRAWWDFQGPGDRVKVYAGNPLNEYYLMPVAFSDPKYNHGASTQGFVEIFNCGQMTRLIFDDASTNAPALGVQTGRFSSGSAPGFPVVANVLNGIDLNLAWKPTVDFDNNGWSDLVLFNPATRASEVQFFDSTKYLKTLAGPAITGGYEFAGVADFNGDNKPDYLLMHSSTRNLAVWFLDGTTYKSGALVRNSSAVPVVVPAGWQIAAAADMNADGKTDLVLFNPSTRNISVWYLDTTTPASGNPQVTVKSSALIMHAGVNAVLPAGFQVTAVVDFNGDGKPDLVLFNPTTRATMGLALNGAVAGAQVAGPTLPSGWQLAGALDTNGKGRPNFLLFNPSTRISCMWHMKGMTHLSGAYLTDSTGHNTVLPAGFSIVGP